MKVLNAMQLKKGAKAEYNRMGSITQPIQFIPRKDKDRTGLLGTQTGQNGMVLNRLEEMPADL